MDYFLDNAVALAGNVAGVMNELFSGPLAGVAYAIIVISVLSLALKTVIRGRGGG